MARITYSSLFLNFTPAATGAAPIQSQIASLITAYYQQAYEIVYGVGNYDDTDTDTTDPESIIRAKEFEGSLVAEISMKVQQWHDSGVNSDGSVNKMPSFDISPELEKKLKRMVAKKTSRLENIRVWGHDWDEVEWI